MDARIVMEIGGATVPNTPIEIIKIDHRTSSALALITLRLPVAGTVQEKDVRLDLGKRWIIDSVGDATVDEYVRAAVQTIWEMAVMMIQSAMDQITGGGSFDDDDGQGSGPPKGGGNGSNGGPKNGSPH